MTPHARPLAIGLVRHRARTSAMDRTWSRAVVIHHAARLHLHLVDILETVAVPETSDVDKSDENDPSLGRLVRLTAATGAQVLVTEGVPLSLARQLAAAVGLRHEPVPRRRARALPEFSRRLQ